MGGHYTASGALPCDVQRRMRLIDNPSVIEATRRWVEKAVIGLGLCPFAEGVYRAGAVRFHVSEQRSAAGLLAELRSELTLLHSSDPRICATTLVIHPRVL